MEMEHRSLDATSEVLGMGSMSDYAGKEDLVKTSRDGDMSEAAR